MGRLGRFLIALGAAVFFVDALAIVIHVEGPPGAMWLINLAVAKLAMLAGGGLMIGGAVTARIAHQREQRRLESTPDGV
jgi:hypothetical protein